jgi:hypothetical protein
MLRGYRFLIVASGLVSILFSLFLGAYFGSLYSPDHKQYQAVSSNQAGQKNYQGPSQSLPNISGLPSLVERAIANPHSTTGEDHEKRDLAAQEASALWAFYMVVASFASVLITAVGTAFLYKQIVLTREAVEDTGKATNAMLRANEIAQAGQRPWIQFEEMRVELIGLGSVDEPTIWIKIELTVCNSGVMPALNVSHWETTYSMGDNMNSYEVQFFAQARKRRKIHGINIAPNGKHTFRLLCTSDTALASVCLSICYDPGTKAEFCQTAQSYMLGQVTQEPSVRPYRLDQIYEGFRVENDRWIGIESDFTPIGQSLMT